MKNITVAGMEETAKEIKRNANNNSNYKKVGFDEKNYLDVRLKKDELKKELRIRLLPIDKDAETPFKIIRMHNVKVPTEISASGWKSYVCLEKTEDINHGKYGDKCPFCELHDEAEKMLKDPSLDPIEKERWKKIAMENKPNYTCIVRCIERGHEEDGPKFWKFTITKEGKDPYHVINDLVATRRQENIDDGASEEEAGNILDLYNGKDLKLTVNAVLKDGKWTNKTSVTVVDYGKEKPLSEDEEEMNRWINDEKKWSDVFVAKPYDYLSIILDGNVPFFDRGLNQWVVKENNAETTNTEEAEKLDAQIEESKQQVLGVQQTESSETLSDGDSDLPF